MSYVDLKHLLADLALAAVRSPADAQWCAVAAACAELATEENPRIPTRACLERARALAGGTSPPPTQEDVTRLVEAGLLDRHGDLLVVPSRFVPHLGYFKRQSPRVLAAITELRGRPASESGTDQAVAIGVALFNAGLFFECHEWFEGIWKATAGASKDFYHGIVQVAAAFYHFEKSNRHGSRTLLEKGLRRLHPYPDTYLGVELGDLKSALIPWAGHFAGGSRPAHYPRIAHKAKGAPRG